MFANAVLLGSASRASPGSLSVNWLENCTRVQGDDAVISRMRAADDEQENGKTRQATDKDRVRDSNGISGSVFWCDGRAGFGKRFFQVARDGASTDDSQLSEQRFRNELFCSDKEGRSVRQLKLNAKHGLLAILYPRHVIIETIPKSSEDSQLMPRLGSRGEPLKGTPRGPFQVAWHDAKLLVCGKSEISLYQTFKVRTGRVPVQIGSIGLPLKSRRCVPGAEFSVAKWSRCGTALALGDTRGNVYWQRLNQKGSSEFSSMTSAGEPVELPSEIATGIPVIELFVMKKDPAHSGEKLLAYFGPSISRSIEQGVVSAASRASAGLRSYGIHDALFNVGCANGSEGTQEISLSLPIATETNDNVIKFKGSSLDPAGAADALKSDSRGILGSLMNISQSNLTESIETLAPANNTNDSGHTHATVDENSAPLILVWHISVEPCRATEIRLGGLSDMPRLISLSSCANAIALCSESTICIYKINHSLLGKGAGRAMHLDPIKLHKMNASCQISGLCFAGEDSRHVLILASSEKPTKETKTSDEGMPFFNNLKQLTRKLWLTCISCPEIYKVTSGAPTRISLNDSVTTKTPPSSDGGYTVILDALLNMENRMNERFDKIDSILEVQNKRLNFLERRSACKFLGKALD